MKLNIFEEILLLLLSMDMSIPAYVKITLWDKKTTEGENENRSIEKVFAFFSQDFCHKMAAK